MNISDVNEIERNIVDALCKAAEQTVSEKSVSKQEWTNNEFLFLIKVWIICKNPLRLKELTYEIKKMWRKLKNNFYGKNVDVLYLASEAKDVEQVCKLLNDFSVINNPPSEKEIIETVKTLKSWDVWNVWDLLLKCDLTLLITIKVICSAVSSV